MSKWADILKGQILVFLEGTPAKFQIQPIFQLYVCIETKNKGPYYFLKKFNMIRFICLTDQ